PLALGNAMLGRATAGRETLARATCSVRSPPPTRSVVGRGRGWGGGAFWHWYRPTHGPPPQPSPPLASARGGREHTEYAAPFIGNPEKKTPMKIEKDVKVAMRDGITISLCVYRPVTDAPCPALFAASPYQWEFDAVPAYPLFLWRETGPIEW